MNKIFLHIGLPKTGTTTLQQDVFPNIDCEYIGVNQPRTLLQTELWGLITRFVSGIDSVDKSYIRSKLSSLLERKSVLLSEEMFLVDQQPVTWQNKVQRLANLLLGFDVEIIVTLREPFAAVTSYYKESYSSNYSLYGRSFFKFVYDSNAALIYQYQVLFNELERVFKGVQIHKYAFENILTQVGLRVMLKDLGLKTTRVIDFGVRNVRNNKDCITVQRKNIFAKLFSKIKCDNNAFVRICVQRLIHWNTRTISLSTSLSVRQEGKLNGLLAPAKLIWHACFVGSIMQDSAHLKE